MWNVEEFRRAVALLCKDHYELENGQTVKGQSMTYVRMCLRDYGWKGISGWRIEKPLQEAGFKISRGRGLRWYRGGKRGLGVTCDVVHSAN